MNNHSRTGKGVRNIIFIIIAAAVLIILLSTAPFLISGKVDAVPVSFYFEQNTHPDHTGYHTSDFSVMSLNIGHGRGAGLNQMTQGRKKITSNADYIAEIVLKEDITLTALQEVDGPGLWNGGLDLIEHLAEASGYAHGIWTKNVDIPALSYGTAVLSSLPYSTAESFTFRARPVVLPKGFTLGVFKVSETDDRHVCVVSVHLDPIFGFMRRKQADAIIEKLASYDYPVIIAGDFNCGWRTGSAVQYLAEKLNLQAWDPESKKYPTRLPGKRRLDWILISDEMEFVHYETLPYILSDHSAVRADIRFKEQ